ncbi:MAG: hypothetical protein M1368_09235 [Thaumarchaeota archaeon]|nr:hypothetical protein [Nitrososphaerota archaeon]
MSKLDLGVERALVFDDKRGRLVASDKSGDHDVLAMPMEAFFGLVDDLFVMFQSGASVILEKAGAGAGKASVKHVLSQEESSKAVRELFSRASRWGLGRYEMVKFDPDSHYAKLRLHQCVFARESDKECRSMWYLRGYLRGYFSTFFRDEGVICTELKCSSLGDKYCEFEIVPQLKQ